MAAEVGPRRSPLRPPRFQLACALKNLVRSGYPRFSLVGSDVWLFWRFLLFPISSAGVACFLYSKWWIPSASRA